MPTVLVAAVTVDRRRPHPQASSPTSPMVPGTWHQESLPRFASEEPHLQFHHLRDRRYRSRNRLRTGHLTDHLGETPLLLSTTVHSPAPERPLEGIRHSQYTNHSHPRSPPHIKKMGDPLSRQHLQESIPNSHLQAQHNDPANTCRQVHQPLSGSTQILAALP